MKGDHISDKTHSECSTLRGFAAAALKDTYSLFQLVAFPIHVAILARTSVIGIQGNEGVAQNNVYRDKLRESLTAFQTNLVFT